MENNLLITFDDKGYQEDYQIRDSFFSRFFDALSDTTAIVYGAYYAKDQWLRHIYFDIIRALNLKDIWIFNEMIVYHYYDESNPIPSFYDFNNVQLSDIQQKIIALISENPQISYTEIANNLNKSRSGIATQISLLQQLGIIKHEGSDKKGYWIIL